MHGSVMLNADLVSWRGGGGEKQLLPAAKARKNERKNVLWKFAQVFKVGLVV